MSAMSAEAFVAGVQLCEELKRQEDPKYRVIRECKFCDNGKVWVRSNYGGWAEDYKPMPALSLWDGFVPEDFIGLTETDALAMVMANVAEEIDLNCMNGLPF